MYTPIKRIIDIVLSGVGIIVLSPLLLVLCIAIKLDSPGPILFKQKRVGIHKKHFMISQGYADTYAEQPGTIYYQNRKIPA